MFLFYYHVDKRNFQLMKNLKYFSHPFYESLLQLIEFLNPFLILKMLNRLVQLFLFFNK